MSQTVKVAKVADWLEKQVSDSSITDGTIWNKLKLSKSSFYRLKPKALLLLNTRSLQRQKELDATKTQEVIEAAKNGLKSKTDRVLFLQKQVEDIETDLIDGKTIELVIINGAVKTVTRLMTPMEKASLRRSIRYIQSEISKMEGDYAPKKVEDVTDYKVIRPSRK